MARVSKHRSGGFWIRVAGLVGISALILILYVLMMDWSGDGSDRDPPVRIAAESARVPGATSLGVAVYERACAVCHDTGVANAPKLGDRATWEPRMEQGIQRLLQSLIAGKGAMPPRGTCAECSDADLRAAIEYLSGPL